MPSYSATQQARRDAGLCLRCGGPRLGAACTLCYCEPCAAIRRESARAAYTCHKQERTPEEARALAERQSARDKADYWARKAEGRCVKCGALPTARDRVQKARLCDTCRRADHASAVANREKRRRESPNWGASRDGKPLPIGGAVKVGVVRAYHVHIDSGALRALRELKRRDREARLKVSPNGKVEVVYQIGRIVRDALRSWADIRDCPTRTPSYRQMIECTFTFGADAQTVAAIERHKHARDGNLSATICDLLVATANRPAYTIKRNAPRLSAGGGTPDPWDDD